MWVFDQVLKLIKSQWLNFDKALHYSLITKTKLYFNLYQGNLVIYRRKTRSRLVLGRTKSWIRPGKRSRPCSGFILLFIYFWLLITTCVVVRYANVAIQWPIKVLLFLLRVILFPFNEVNSFYSDSHSQVLNRSNSKWGCGFFAAPPTPEVQQTKKS